MLIKFAAIFVFTYLCSIFICITHELGHAAAALATGLKIGKVVVGLGGFAREPRTIARIGRLQFDINRFGGYTHAPIIGVNTAQFALNMLSGSLVNMALGLAIILPVGIDIHNKAFLMSVIGFIAIIGIVFAYLPMALRTHSSNGKFISILLLVLVAFNTRGTIQELMDARIYTDDCFRLLAFFLFLEGLANLIPIKPLHTDGSILYALTRNDQDYFNG